MAAALQVCAVRHAHRGWRAASGGRRTRTRRASLQLLPGSPAYWVQLSHQRTFLCCLQVMDTRGTLMHPALSGGFARCNGPRPGRWGHREPRAAPPPEVTSGAGHWSRGRRAARCCEDLAESCVSVVFSVVPDVGRGDLNSCYSGWCFQSISLSQSVFLSAGSFPKDPQWSRPKLSARNQFPSPACRQGSVA